jgi:hypothetical protein
MNPPRPQSDFNFEQTLRQLAQAPAPAGLQERVQARLAAAARPQKRDWRAFFAELFEPQSNWRKGLEAAAIVLLVFGVGWGIALSIQQPAPSAQAAPPPVGVTVGGGFSSAGAIRTPQTLQGPAVKATDSADDESAPMTPAGQTTDRQDKHSALENKADKALSQAPPSK